MLAQLPRSLRGISCESPQAPLKYHFHLTTSHHLLSCFFSEVEADDQGSWCSNNLQDRKNISDAASFRKGVSADGQESPSDSKSDDALHIPEAQVDSIFFRTFTHIDHLSTEPFQLVSVEEQNSLCRIFGSNSRFKSAA